VAVAFVFAACTSGASGGAPLPPSPARVDVIMNDNVFHNPATVPAGRQVFRITNAGATDHSLVLISLPEDVPAIVDQLRSDDRRGVPTFAKVPARAPGSNDTFAVDLLPGRYALLCFVTDPDGVSHAAKGMASEFRVE
jgi:hypothetical protein